MALRPNIHADDSMEIEKDPTGSKNPDDTTKSRDRTKQDRFMVNNSNEPNNANSIDTKKQKKILNSKYLSRLKDEGEGLPELRVI